MGVFLRVATFWLGSNPHKKQQGLLGGPTHSILDEVRPFKVVKLGETKVPTHKKQRFWDGSGTVLRQRPNQRHSDQGAARLLQGAAGACRDLFDPWDSAVELVRWVHFRTVPNKT